VPNLGVVRYREDLSFVMADIPGIIEGASQGKGLGLRFLRHIERNSILLFLIPATSEDPAQDYRILLNELTEYNPELLDKQRIIAVSKCDLVPESEHPDLVRQLPADVPHVLISSLTNLGIEPMKDLIWQALQGDQPLGK
jgi:GTP-binding protein